MHSVKMIGMTHCTIGDCTPEGAIAYMARVSNPENQDNPDGVDKLIRYLIKNAHWSPFEVINLVFEIECPRDISRQILRHRSFTFQEFSQRYAKVENFDIREPRLQDTKNRQNSVELDMSDEQQKLLALEWERAQKRILFTVKKEYEWALNNGIAKEQARALLPEGLTMSKLYMSGTLRSFIHYCQLRMENGTQKEHALIAKDIWKVIAEHFPNVTKALEQ